MKHSFWTRAYRNGHIHGCYNSVEKREEITLTLPDGSTREARTVRAAQIIITRRSRP